MGSGRAVVGLVLFLAALSAFVGCGSRGFQGGRAVQQKSGWAMKAGDLYARGQIENLVFDPQRGTIVLDDWALAEDDADGAGFPFEQDMLRGDTRIRKDLIVDAAEAREARLLIFHVAEDVRKTKPVPAAVRITVNGRELAATLNSGWNAVAIDPAWLVEGRNEVILSTPAGGQPANVPIAGRAAILDNVPWRATVGQRSFKSADGGKTWSPRLGRADQAAGEYMLRLHLRRYAATGTWLSPVLDLLDPERRQPVKPLAAVESLAARLQQETPGGTSLSCFVRTGATPVVEPAAWESWRHVVDGRARPVRGRYAQVKVVLATNDARQTPAWQGLALDVTAAPRPSAMAGRLTVEQYTVFPVIRSSLPFRYESLCHPSLQQLRRQYGLDDVVRGAATQFEAVVRLNHWVSQQWAWHAPEDYPEWDALRILEKLPDGQSRGGFCGQYAIVMTQCCLAMGIQARYVFGGWPGVVGGHEVVEFWSDEHGKWVLMDPNMDRYYLDRRTGVPLGVLELHQAILQHYYPDGSSIGTTAENQALYERVGFDRFAEEGPQAVHGGRNAGPDWFDPRRAHLMWGQPHLMPGNDFFSRPRPCPRQHGYGLPWVWNGYFHWSDSQTPRQPFYTGYTDRPGDYWWNLNQVDLFLEETDEPGVLRVTAETFTPELETLLLSVDDGPWVTSAATFSWPLKGGANVLQVRTRNVADVEGRPSMVRLTWRG